MAETCRAYRELLGSDSYAWRVLCERSKYQRSSRFSWRTTFRAERFIERNFGSIQPVIALNLAAGFGLTEVIAYILDTREVEVNAQTDFASAGYTQVGSAALHAAAKNNKLETIQFLISHGANPNVFDFNGRTPLMLAASHGHINSCEMLLRAGADLNLATHFGFTPLHFAAMTHSSELVDLLLRSGAVVDTRDQRGWTPLVVALNSTHTCNLSHNFQRAEASGAAAVAMQDAVTSKLVSARKTMARLLLAGADLGTLPDRAATLGLGEISLWLREFSKHLTHN